ncbi:MAG: hypothetical protein AAFY41_01955 [Bacteroidota bacterium]
MKRVIWLLLIGTMIAFHNTYKKEFKSIDQIEVIVEEDEED